MFTRRKVILSIKRIQVKSSFLRRIHLGTVCIIVGVAAIIAAGAIWLYNDRNDRLAGETSQEKVEILLEIIMSNDTVNVEVGSAVTESTVDAPVPTVYRPGADMPNIADIPEEDVVDIPQDVRSPYVVVQREPYMGILSIPRFGLNLPVNVAWSYPKLRSTPCRYAGSVERNDLVIAAHSYKSHFGNIHTLVEGDAVVFTDVDGFVFEYQVMTVETVKPTDARNVVTSLFDLTLFTCTYDSKARVVVRCNMVRVEEPDVEPEFEDEPESEDELEPDVEPELDGETELEGELEPDVESELDGEPGLEGE